MTKEEYLENEKKIEMDVRVQLNINEIIKNRNISIVKKFAEVVGNITDIHGHCGESYYNTIYFTCDSEKEYYFTISNYGSIFDGDEGKEISIRLYFRRHTDHVKNMMTRSSSLSAIVSKRIRKEEKGYSLNNLLQLWSLYKTGKAKNYIKMLKGRQK